MTPSSIRPERETADTRRWARRRGEGLHNELITEVVTDKGSHSNETVRDFTEMGIRMYLSEPDRGRRQWAGKAAEQAAVYANHRQIRGEPPPPHRRSSAVPVFGPCSPCPGGEFHATRRPLRKREVRVSISVPVGSVRGRGQFRSCRSAVLTSRRRP